MSEEYMAGIDDRRSCRSNIEGSTEQEYRTEGPGGDGPSLTAAPSMLGDLRLAGRGNSSLRAAAIQRMQQTHGNRAVQRFIQRTSATQTMPVQRQDEEEQKKLSFRPWLPELKLPFGGGWGLTGEGKGIGLGYKRGGTSGGIGYNWGGPLTAEGGFKTGWGKGSVGLEFDPWKKEGTAGLRFGNVWIGGGYGPHGPSFGLGYGDPVTTPPGLPTNPSDPAKEWRQGEIGAGMFQPPGEVEKNKKGWAVGGGLGRDGKGNPFPWLGVGGYW
jgi:hypothetical protein